MERIEKAPIPRQSTLNKTTWLIMLGLIVILLVEIVFATSAGYLKIPLSDVIYAIMSKITGIKRFASHLDETTAVVLMDVRLPRILTAAVVGAGLSLCGAVYQGILLNPLADPYTLGVSAGAAFGASLALLMGVTWLGVCSVSLFAFAGAVTTLMIVIYLTASSGDMSSSSLILSGIIVAAILSAGVSFMKYLADEQVSLIIFWLMGSFAAKTWSEVGVVFGALVLGLMVSLLFSRDLNLLALGSRAAGALGISPRKVSLVLLVTASLVAAVCVAVSGIIGFVGLLVPHMVRFVVGPDNRRLIPVSALVGACLLLCADTVTRALLPQEIPIGVITALIGGPFFCYIFRKRQMGQAE